MVKVSQKDDEYINIAIGEPNCILLIEIHKFNLKNDLFLMPEKKIIKTLTSHIVYKEDLNTYKWLDQSETFFDDKEKNSNFLNIEYVHQHLGVIPYKLECEILTSVDNIEFRVLVLTYKEYEKAEIHRGIDIKEILYDSSSYKYLERLQCFKLSTNIYTLTRSLEFQALVRKIFNISRS